MRKKFKYFIWIGLFILFSSAVFAATDYNAFCSSTSGLCANACESDGSCSTVTRVGCAGDRNLVTCLCSCSSRSPCTTISGVHSAHTACTTENNYCSGSSCQDKCSDNVDNDGDGFKDGQDTDCDGYGECSSGSCCNTNNGQLRPATYVCNPGTDCLNDAKCNGVSASCPSRTNKAAGTACGSSECLECDGSGNCAAMISKQDIVGPYTCDATCRYCDNTGKCEKQPYGWDLGELCTNYYYCSSLTTWFNHGACNYDGNCGVSHAPACGGGENNMCTGSSGVCQNKCTVGGGDDDGDGLVDSCDPDCGAVQCTSGGCCDTSTCTYRSNGYVCRASEGTCDPAEKCTGSSKNCPSDSLTPYGNGNCGACKYCTGSSAYCSNVAANTDPFSSCSGNCDECDGSGACRGDVGLCTSIPATECWSTTVFPYTLKVYYGSCSRSSDTNYGCSYPYNSATCASSTPYCTDGVCVECLNNAQCTSTPASECHVTTVFPNTRKIFYGVCDLNDHNTCKYNNFNVNACPSNTPYCVGAGQCVQCISDAQCNDNNPCTVDTCSGAGSCSNVAGNANAVCRASEGTCDPAEKCTGTSKNCPSDTKYNGNYCGTCQYCNGVNNNCVNIAANTDPYSSCSGNCDTCDGSGSCKADGSKCAGNCDQCSQQSSIKYDCAAAPSLCSGTCAQCSKLSNTVFNCAVDSSKCSGNCASCYCDDDPATCAAGDSTAFSCGANSNCLGTSASCSCVAGSATSFSCSVCSGSTSCSGGACVGCTADWQCDDGNPCSKNMCSVSGFCDYSQPAASSTVCRPTGGNVCDKEEKCDGTTTVCPFDAKQSEGFDCGTKCQSCNGAGSCVNTDSSHDWQGECNPSFTSCTGPGSCQRTGESDYCNGAGACATQTVNIAPGKVCTTGGAEVPVSCSNYCSADTAFCSGAALKKDVHSCNGVGSCSGGGSTTLTCTVDPLGCKQCDVAGDCTAVPSNQCSSTLVYPNTRRVYYPLCTGGLCDYNNFNVNACPSNTPYCVGAGQCVQCISDAQCNDNNPCTADYCNAAGTCKNNTATPAVPAVQCRSRAGDCNPADYCNGVSTSCPSDTKYNGNYCGDACKFCNGISNDCVNVAANTDPYGSCIGTCDTCDGSGACKAVPSSCTGTCSQCSQQSSIRFDCAAKLSSCPGNCAQCSQVSSTVFNCAVNDALCLGNCDYCAFSAGQYNCAAGTCAGTSASCGCSGAGNSFSCTTCVAPTNCNAGVCGCTQDSHCDDGNPCSLNKCNLATNTCDYSSPVGSGIFCKAADPANPCDADDYCTATSTTCLDKKKDLGADCPGKCSSCDGFGTCVLTDSSHDWQNECTPGFNQCDGYCQRRGEGDNCNGAGNCGTQTAFIASGKVCTGAGVETPLGCANACGFGIDTCAAPNIVRSPLGCNGAGLCTFASGSCVVTPLGCAECTSAAQCITPPPASCVDISTIKTYTPGCNAAYNCTYTPVNTACPSGQTCSLQAGVAVCSAHCGNGVLETTYGEECDDHNLVNGDGCDSLCRETNCSIVNPDIVPFIGCSGFVCSMNDLLNVQFSVRGGSCDKPKNIQIDFYSVDGLCMIQRSGVDMFGISTNFTAARLIPVASLPPFMFNYTMPSIPDACAGKLLEGITIGLYSDDFSVLRSDDYLYEYVNPITLDQCSQFGNVSQYKSFPIQGIKNGLCIANTCYNYDAVPVIINTTVPGVHVRNISGGYNYYACGVVDGFCPDDFYYLTGCGSSGVCSVSGIADGDCMAQIPMRCGLSLKGAAQVWTCNVPVPTPVKGCTLNTSCVYADEVTGENATCYNIGQVIHNALGYSIECMNMNNTWCPEGFTYNSILKRCQLLTIQCSQNDCPQVVPVADLVQMPAPDNPLYTKWLNYIANDDCFHTNLNTSRRYERCAVVSRWPFNIYDWIGIDIIYSIPKESQGPNLLDNGDASCIDTDGDGHYLITSNCVGSDDCDDANSLTFPGAEEICNTAADENCNGKINDGCEYCKDYDEDGYYRVSAGCSGSNDCNDYDSNINPGAREICNSKDDNCNKKIDEDCISFDKGVGKE